MAQLRPIQNRYVRKVGYQVPEHVQTLMELRHPTVRILWDRIMNCYCLVQAERGFVNMIARLRGPITLSNTVYVLDKIHPGRFQCEGDMDRFLNKLDVNTEAEAQKKRAQNQIAEGSKDLWNAMNRRVLRRVK